MRYSFITKCGLVITLLPAVLLFTAYLSIQFSSKPSLLENFSSALAYYDKQGRLLRIDLSKDQKYRLITGFEKFPKSLKLATVLYEDKGFYEHGGVDISALFRAFYQTYIAKQRRIGASTITMQVARLKWQLNSSTPIGKLEQIFRAWQLEAHYSKEEILEAYFNIAPYGGNIEGAQAASLIYFGKSVRDLNELEAISLAVIPQNPNKRTPTGPKNRQAIREAASRLYAMSPSAFKSLSIASLSLPLAYKSRHELPFYAPHFIQYAAKTLPTTSPSEHISGYPSSVQTTLDLKHQLALENVLTEHLERKREFGINNASALLLNYRSMEIEAMLGSADFADERISGQVNGTLSKRSPGSTLKPLLFALSFDAGLIHPQSLVKDLPTKYLDFSPENADSQYKGPISASMALLSSRNLPAVELQQALLHSNSLDLYQALALYGLDLQAPTHYGLALSLGGLEVSMLELSRIYASFANGGEIRDVATLQDKYQQKASRTERVLSKEASYMILSTLAKHKRPLDYKSQSLRYTSDHRLMSEVAWKTGTSWGYRDAWAVGIAGDYVLAVWVGNFSGQANPAFQGFEAAGPILFGMFERLVKVGAIDKNWRVETAFSDLKGTTKTVSVCEKTGDLNEKGCSKQIDTLFIPGKSPIKSSNIYRPVELDIATKMRVCEGFDGPTSIEYFEVWPSDIHANFMRAGINIPAIPKLHPSCHSDKNASGANLFSAPEISSPLDGQRYVIPISQQGKPPNTIALRATADGLTKVLHWFVNGEYLGSSAPNEALFYELNSEAHTITVSDDQGQTTSVTITVEVI